MKTKDTKIQFYALIKRDWKSPNQEDIVETPFYDVKDVLEYVYKTSKKKRFYNLKNDKFCFLDNLSIDQNFLSGFFKSARNEFRPNLINKTTGNERKNPKEKTEGDIEKTHFVIRVDNTNNEVYLFLEHNHTGISIQNVINYLNKFGREYASTNNINSRFSVFHQMIARNNFLTELDKLERTKIAEIHVDKQILGNDFLNFSNRTISIQKDILLKVKAERSEDIKNFAVDVYNKFSGKKNDSISKIRIRGQDENGNETFIDTSFMGQVDFIPAKLDDDTGEAVTKDLLIEIRKIANSF